MIRSMTGFGHGEVSNDKNQKVTVEMKSVNHRYCDISLKLPKKLAMFEANIRNIMKEYASRGKIDIYVSYEDLSETAVSLHYNQAMAEEYMQVFKKMQEDFNIETKITAEALAKYPEVVTIEEVQQDEEVWWELLEAALRQAAEKFVETRPRAPRRKTACMSSSRKTGTARPAKMFCCIGTGNIPSFPARRTGRKCRIAFLCQIGYNLGNLNAGQTAQRK